MSNTPGKATRGAKRVRTLLLLLAILTSPILCCSGMQLPDALPSAWLPAPLDFVTNLFETDVRVENKTSQTLYLTAITTTYGEPRVISQNIAFRQRDIPVEPQSSVLLQYDAADFPLAGIAVCRMDTDCRLLPVSYSPIYKLDSYENLAPLDPNWVTAIQSVPRHNYITPITIAFSLIPILLFSGWLYLNRHKQSATN